MPASRPDPPTEAPVDDRLTVILVHGTGAALAEDQGPAWWQVGGKFQTWLEKNGGARWQVQPPLFGELKLHPSGQYLFVENHIFHWSGKNSEATRREAGERLAESLWELEKNGRPYALVGHSHGGSIVWHALLHLYSTGRPLHSLRSAVTLGTPFLRFGPRYALLRQLMLVISATIGVSILQKYWLDFWNQSSDLLNSGEYSSLALAIASFVGWIFVLIASIFTSVACAYNGWLEIRRRNCESRMAGDLRDRLLCISLATDEAINALAVTVPLRTFSERNNAKIYSGWITRVTDWIIVDRLVRQAAGNDIRGLSLLEVGRTPVPKGNNLAEYPTRCRQPIERRVEETAGKNWLDLQDRFRETAERREQPSRVSELVCGFQFGDFLTHCQYYDDEAIEQHISGHIRGENALAETVQVPDLPLPRPAPESIRWAATALTLASLLVLGYLLSRTGELVLNNGTIKTVLQRAPFTDAAADPNVQMRYLFALVTIGRADEAARLAPDLSEPWDQARAKTIIQFKNSSRDRLRSVQQDVLAPRSQEKEPDRAKLIAAFPRWPIEDSYLLGMLEFDPDYPLGHITVESERDRALRERKAFDEAFTRQFIGEEYLAYLADKALETAPTNVPLVAETLTQTPAEWHDLSLRWLVRAWSKWGRKDLALPYLQKYSRAARDGLAASGSSGTYAEAAVAMELLDLSESFHWLGEDDTANELSKLGEQQLADEGLTLNGVVGATLWANQGRLDRMRALLREGTWEEWRKTVSGMRKLSFRIWDSQRFKDGEPLVHEYIDALLEDSEPERLRRLEALVPQVPQIVPPSARSSALREIALGYVELGRTRAALDLADGCLARDRLSVYTEILLTLAGIRRGDELRADLQSRANKEWR